jgi:Flp pilus assembly protein TadB
VVIALAPLAFCALSAGVDRRTAAFLLQSRTGGILLAAGLGFDALGMAWMARLTRAPR